MEVTTREVPEAPKCSCGVRHDPAEHASIVVPLDVEGTEVRTPDLRVAGWILAQLARGEA